MQATCVELMTMSGI